MPRMLLVEDEPIVEHAARISLQRLLEVLVFVEGAATKQAATYRERGASLLEVAEEESDPSIRKKLLELADRYEQLATSVEISRSC